MKTVEINGTLRKEIGKTASKELRKKGEVPCVLYGGEKNINFTANEKQLSTLLYTPEVLLVDVNIDGTKYRALLQESQFHPVSDKVLHLDFFQITDSKPVVIEVPVKLVGLAKGVKEGGKIQLNVRKLKVKALAQNLPNILEVNVENVGLGQTIKVAEVKFDNLEILTPSSTNIAAVKSTRASKTQGETA